MGLILVGGGCIVSIVFVIRVASFAFFAKLMIFHFALFYTVQYSSEKPILAPRTPSEKPDGCTTVFVGNLSFSIDEDTLREAFASCGEIASVRFAEDRETGAFKGFGHIEFVDSESTDKAVAMAGEDVMGRAIRVDYAADRRGGEFF